MATHSVLCSLVFTLSSLCSVVRNTLPSVLLTTLQASSFVLVSFILLVLLLFLLRLLLLLHFPMPFVEHPSLFSVYTLLCPLPMLGEYAVHLAYIQLYGLCVSHIAWDYVSTHTHTHVCVCVWCVMHTAQAHADTFVMCLENMFYRM